MKIGFAQINPTVGDLQGNFEKIAKAYDELAQAGADIVIAPELAVTGYPPQDLLFKSRFVPENLAALDRLQKRLSETALLVGFVDRNEGRGKPFHNAAALLQAHQPMQKTHKSLLPTYDVFDEDRYFQPATKVAPLNFRGRRIGVTICEDIWTERYLPRPLYECDPLRSLVNQEAEIILNVSASPFNLRKPGVRREFGDARTDRDPRLEGGPVFQAILPRQDELGIGERERLGEHGLHRAPPQPRVMGRDAGGRRMLSLAVRAMQFLGLEFELTQIGTRRE